MHQRQKGRVCVRERVHEGDHVESRECVCEERE